MSRVNLQPDLFLGLHELNRNTKFLKDDGYIRLLKSIINNFGIVNVDIDTNFENFLVQEGTNSGTIKIATESFAVDKDLNIINKKIEDNIAVTDDSSWYWVKISHQESNYEEGVIDVAMNGSITGIGTKFSEVLRDQNSYPVKINFPDSLVNTGDYQVVSVLSDTQAFLSGSTGFVSENGLKYRVVGSFTPGINPSGNDRLPYFYDDCLLELVAETVLDTEPAKVSGSEFYVARVMNSGGTITVQDKRTEILGVSKTNTGWIEPSLGVEFTNASGKEIRYRKNYIGEIEIEGAFTTTDGEATLFTLPVGFRPAYKIFGIYSYDDGSVVRLISVDENGVVKAATTFPFHETNVNQIVNLRFKTE